MSNPLAMLFSGRDDFSRFFSALSADESRQLFKPYEGELVAVSYTTVVFCKGFSLPRECHYLGVITAVLEEKRPPAGIPTTRYAEGFNGSYFLRQGYLVPRDFHSVEGEPMQMTLDLEGPWHLILGSESVLQWLTMQRATPCLTDGLVTALRRG